MDNIERAKAAVEILKKEYPGAVCSLTYTKPHELLIATRLSAQCTDARVNIVTPVLFGKYPTIDALAEADEQDISDIIHSCGFYKMKAHDISQTCKILRDKYNGVVPDTVEELIKLPGVGRKTANLVVGDIYGKPAVVCDTHCIRITNLLGLTDTKDPAKCEIELRKLLDPKESNDFCHRTVLHGRAVCVARHPKCENCVLKKICAYAQTENEIKSK